MYGTYRQMESSMPAWLLHKLRFLGACTESETENLPFNVGILYKSGFSQTNLMIERGNWSAPWVIVGYVLSLPAFRYRLGFLRGPTLENCCRLAE